jgi:hypothetical protein
MKEGFIILRVYDDRVDFERQYEKQVVPVKEKIAAGGFDKYLVPTSYWMFMREDAEARADRCRLWGYKDVVVLQGKRE